MVKIKPHLEKYTRPSSVFPSRKDKIRLNWNEFCPGYPPAVVEAMFASLTPSLLSSYPEYDVIYPLVAAHLGVAQDQVILASGSESGIKNVFEVLVGSGSNVVKTDPDFVMVQVYADMFDATIRNAHFSKTLAVPVPALLKAIDDDTALVYLANPHAPTGQYFERTDVLRILTRAHEVDAAVLVDECYIEFSGKPSSIDLIPEFDNLIISRSFSKAFGLAGLRIGALATNARLNAYLHRTKPMREINSMAVEAGVFLLQNPEIPRQMIAEVVATREWFSGVLRGYGYAVPASLTNFILVDFGKDEARFLERCREHNVLVRGRDKLVHAAVSDYLRITIGTRKQMETVHGLLFPL